MKFRLRNLLLAGALAVLAAGPAFAASIDADGKTSGAATPMHSVTTTFTKPVVRQEVAPQSVVTPPHAANVITSTAVGGNWSAGGTWVGGSAPLATDDVVIANGATVTIDVNETANSVTIGQGTSGILQYNNTAATTLTVTTNLTVSAGGTFQSNPAGTITTHQLTIGGSIINNGTFDLSTNTNTAGGAILFNGATSAVFSGTGATTDIFGPILVTKTGNASVTLSPTNFTYKGNASTAGTTAAFLRITSGQFIIGGTFTGSSSVFTLTGTDTIPAAGQFTLNNPNYTVAARTGSMIVSGKLEVDAGTLSVGTAQGNGIQYNTGSSITITGGAVNVASRLFGVTTAQTTTYNQSGGTLTLTTVSNTSTTQGSFDLQAAGSSFTMSNGSIVFQVSKTVNNAPDWNVLTNNVNITGGTAQFGNASSVSARTFQIAGNSPSIVISNSFGHSLTLINNVTDFGGLTLQGAANTIALNTWLFVVKGNVSNAGVINCNPLFSRFYFQGAGAQTYSGAGTAGTAAAPMQSWEIDNPVGVTISAASPTVITLRVNFFNTGGSINSNKLQLGVGGTSAATTQYGQPGGTITVGNYDVLPTFNAGTGGLGVIYSQESSGRTTGIEIPASRTLGFGEVDNTNGVTLAGGNLTVTGTGGSMTLSNGTLNTGASTLIIPAGGSLGRLNGWVNGNLQKNVTTGSSVVRQFEIGSSTTYTPVQLTFASVSGAGNIVGNTTNGDHGSIATSGINAAKSVNRFWTLTNSGVTFTNYNATFNFVAGDVDGGANTNNFSIRKFNSPNWTATTTGTRTATSTQATGVTSFSDFQIGELTNHTITASAGAGGSISPSGAVSVADLASQTFTITPTNACFTIADVVVDGSSVGAVGSYTFSNVTTDHTITASFNQTMYSIVASSDANGVIAPSGTVSVGCGTNQTFTLTPNSCYHLANVVVDGVSRGAVASYTFTNVGANHTISASFALTTYTIVASAGTGGSISPSGNVGVNCGDSPSFTITANGGYTIANVVVDGVSQGATASYTFNNVGANHTIAASFTASPATIAGVSTSTFICPTNTCVTIPVNLSRGYATGILGYSVTFQLGGGLTLCSGTSSVNEGSYLNSVGSTIYNVVDNGGGSYTVDAALTSNCGATGLSGNLFNVGVASSSPGGTGTITVTAVSLRDCSNAPLPAAAGAPATVPIDNAGPTVTVGAPNGGESWLIGTTQNITWTATDPNGVTTVDLAYSTDGGSTFPNVIATGLANSGSYAWMVPNTPSTTARVRVTAHDGACGTAGFDDSDANFTIRDPQIVASAAAGGSITPSGVVSVPYGTNQSFTIAGDGCHSIADVVVDGGSVGATGSYTFNNVTVDHTISATFSVNTYTIVASAGPGGTITPSGNVSVNCGSDQTFTIAPDACHTIADVVVDGSSVGATASYTFNNVTANHTIAATFNVIAYTIVASAGSGGSITPSGNVSVNCGSDQSFTIAPDGCHTIADVLVDGSSVGAVASYTFNNVTANHTIAASFSLNSYTIVASAGSGGSITPSGNVSVNCGDNQSFTIAPFGTCSHIADVVVDGSSVGAVASYTFTNVTTNHTITASFAVTVYTIAASAGPGGSISPSGNVSVNCGDDQTFTIAGDACHTIADVTVDGGSVGATASYTFNGVSANHTISATFALINYAIQASAGTGGTITPSGVVSVGCGANQSFTIAGDACHHVADVVVDGVSQGASASYTFANVTANHTIAASFASNAATVGAVTALSALQVKSGNDADGTTKITLTFTAPGGAASVEVWRKGFGSYPTYDDGGGSVPPVPGSYPPAGWTLTSVTASGQTDEPATRDFWYYVAYAKDACGATGPVSNETSGTLDYHLGDVSDGITPGQGDNSVSTADISLLGAHYGASGAALAGFEYLDVGPTTDHSTNARPTTDQKADFEDLVMFALNYTPHVSVASVKGKGPVAATADGISLTAPEIVNPGDQFDVAVTLTAAGDLQALSVTLGWNPAVVEPVGVAAGDLVTSQGGVVFSPGPGRADAALLGAGQGMVGQGPMAIVTFHAIAAGVPRVSLSQVIGRNSSNQNVTVTITNPTAVDGAVVTATQFAPVLPNPSRGATLLQYSLAKAGPVDLAIYSVDGRRVKTLAHGVQGVGNYRVMWDGSDDRGTVVRSGMFFARFEGVGVRKTRTITLLK